MKNLALVALLTQSCDAIKFEFFSEPHPIHPHDYHWNEDYHSVPDPISGVNWMTSTQAKYFRENTTDVSSEPMGINQDYFSAYNENSKEPVEQPYLLQLDADLERPEEEVTVLWHVSPDYGEDDDKVVTREQDTKNGEKKSGWTNPLGWTDNGHDDHQILAQRESMAQMYGVNKPRLPIEASNDANRHPPVTPIRV